MINWTKLITSLLAWLCTLFRILEWYNSNAFLRENKQLLSHCCILVTFYWLLCCTFYYLNSFFFTFTCDLLTYGYPTVVPRTSLLPSLGARKKRDPGNVFDLNSIVLHLSVQVHQSILLFLWPKRYSSSIVFSDVWGELVF